MKTVPNFALYGNSAHPSWEAAVHIEKIPERSRPQHWSISAHTHDALIQVLYITHGTGETFMDDHHWAFVAPCLVIAPAGVVHGFRFSSDVDGPVVTAAQRPLESMAALMAPGLLEHMRHPAVLALDQSLDPDRSLSRLFAAIEREAHWQARGLPCAGLALMLAIFAEVSRHAQFGHRPTTLAHSRKAGQIERFRRLLDQRCRQRLSVADYASALGVTPGHLSRLSREVLGMSALDVINARLIHEARRELAYSTLSVKQVASALGFADEAYFGRLFKRHTGQRPSDFRVSARRELAPASA